MFCDCRSILNDFRRIRSYLGLRRTRPWLSKRPQVTSHQFHTALQSLFSSIYIHVEACGRQDLDCISDPRFQVTMVIKYFDGFPAVVKKYSNMTMTEEYTGKLTVDNIKDLDWVSDPRLKLKATIFTHYFDGLLAVANKQNHDQKMHKKPKYYM